MHALSRKHGGWQLLASVDVAQQRGAREPAGSWRGGHRLELAGGLLPPWVLDRVCAVLARSQGGQFQVSGTGLSSPRYWHRLGAGQVKEI